MNELYISGIRRNLGDEDPGAYPYCLPAVRHLHELRFTSPVTFFVGENGAGKSTLLEAIALCYGFNPEGGSINFRFSTADTHSELYRRITLMKGVRRPKDGYFLRAESFYNVVSEIDRLGVTDAYGGESLHNRSHGEGFMALMLDRFFGNGLYLLDEPEAALSPSRQMALLSRMHDLVQQRSQFLIATHSPILMAYPGAQIFMLGDEGIVLTPYKETEHYIVTKEFLSNPERLLKTLLS